MQTIALTFALTAVLVMAGLTLLSSRATKRELDEINAK